MSNGQRSRKWTRLRVATLAVAVTVFAAGCGLLDGPSAQDPAHAADNGAVRIGILSTVDNAPVKIAENHGFFREQGLDVEVSTFKSGPEALDEVAAGRLDICLINWVSFFRAVKNGTVDARAIADAYQATPDSLVLMTRGDAGIEEPRDLVDKKVSIHSPGNINELLVRALLQTHGMDPSSPKYLPVVFPNIEAALDRKEIDAGVMVEPYITRAARKIGAIPAFKLAVDSTADMPLSGYVALTSFTKDNPDKVAAFQRGIRKANGVANNGRAELAEVLPALAEVPVNDVPLLNLGHYPTSVEATRLQRVVDLMVAFGGMEPGLQAADLIVAMPEN